MLAASSPFFLIGTVASESYTLSLHDALPISWTIGLAKTGNEGGLNWQELAALPAEEVKRKVAIATDGLAKSGAHYVVESIADVLPVIEEIEQRLKMDDRP